MKSEKLMKNKVLLENLEVVVSRHKVLLEAAVLINDSRIEDVLVGNYEKRVDSAVKRIDCSELIAIPAYLDVLDPSIATFKYHQEFDVAEPSDETVIYLNHNLAVKLDVFKFDRGYLAFVLKNLYQSQVILDPSDNSIDKQAKLLRSMGYPLTDIAAYTSLNYLEYQAADDRVGNIQKGKQANIYLCDKDLNVVAQIIGGRMHVAVH